MAFFDSSAQPTFLHYLERLDDFLSTRVNRHSLESGTEAADSEYELRRDPDVRRLLEAIAFASHQAASESTHKLQEAVRTLATGPFEVFDRPTPSSVLASARLGGARLAAVDLPADTSFSLSDAQGTQAIFTNPRPVRILPISLSQVETRATAQGEIAIRLLFRAMAPFCPSQEAINLHIDALGDTAATTRLYFLLRRHIERAYYYPTHDSSLALAGDGCLVAFSDGIEGSVTKDGLGPVGDLRRALAHPTSLCTIQLATPQLVDKTESFEIRLILGRDWPEDQFVSLRNFQLHTIRLENRFSAVAAPIVFDGRKLEVELQALQPADAILHHIQGVFEAGKNGHELIAPAALATSNRWWSLARFDTGNAQWELHPYVRLQLPDAVHRPKVVSIEAQWMQPETCRSLRGRLHVTTYDRVLDGVSWAVHGMPTAPQLSPISRLPEATLQMMAWRGQSLLAMPGIRLFLRLLGLHDQHELAPMLHALREIRGEEAMVPSTGGLRLRVQIYCDDVPEADWGLLCTLLLVVAQLLRIWSPIPVDFQLGGTAHPMRAAFPEEIPRFALASRGHRDGGGT